MAEQQTPVEAYAQLSQAQRTELATHFLEQMKQANHEAYNTYSHIDVNTVTAEQLAELHDHTARHLPNVFGVVMAHPVITAALAGFAVYEVDKHLGKK
jgi:ABC-type transport system involved in cytochrome bd biosynthesis fused ATPase/permease subunit